MTSVCEDCPAGPGGPIGPCGPCGPEGPCGPAAPIGPGDPGGPSSPLGPLESSPQPERNIDMAIAATTRKERAGTIAITSISPSARALLQFEPFERKPNRVRPRSDSMDRPIQFRSDNFGTDVGFSHPPKEVIFRRRPPAVPILC